MISIEAAALVATYQWKMVRIFKDPDRFKELTEMLTAEVPFLAIARHFHCNHTSVIYHARKMGIEPLEPFITRHRIKVILPYDSSRVRLDTRHEILRTEKINSGKGSYVAYLQAEQERKTKRFNLGGIEI